MNLNAWITIIVILIMLIALVRDLFPADVVTFSALTILIAFGIITPEDAAKGFGNKGMLTVALLFPIAYAAQSSGILNGYSAKIFGSTAKKNIAVFRVMLPVFALSSFLNNTPVVAMFIPVVRDWAIKSKLSPSKFLLPVSYASIFGGACTLIGTSTNLVANGMLLSSKGVSFKMFDFAYVGIPCAVAGTIFLLFWGYKILPNNKDLLDDFASSKSKYLFSMRVTEGSQLSGISISEGRLRNLKDVFLVSVKRNGEEITPVKPTERLFVGDYLFFTGGKSAVRVLNSLGGLEPVSGDENIVDRKMKAAEVVISVSSKLVGLMVKDINFRGRFDAAVIAVKRMGDTLESSIGHTTLKAGDTLLLAVGDDFEKRHDDGRDFFLISKPENIIQTDNRKTIISICSITGMVVLSAFGIVDIFVGAFVALCVLLATKTISAIEARRSIELNVLVVIACSLGLGVALEKSGAASYIAGIIIGVTDGMGAIWALAAVMFATTVLTELITNNAAVALIFPIAISVADKAGVSPLPFALATAISASASFATPIGYQTNLMVYGPGGYKFIDYVKVGLPLNIIFYIVSLITIPIFFKF